MSLRPAAGGGVEAGGVVRPGAGGDDYRAAGDSGAAQADGGGAVAVQTEAGGDAVADDGALPLGGLGGGQQVTVGFQEANASHVQTGGQVEGQARLDGAKPGAVQPLRRRAPVSQPLETPAPGGVVVVGDGDGYGVGEAEPGINAGLLPQAGCKWE